MEGTKTWEQMEQDIFLSPDLVALDLEYPSTQIQTHEALGLPLEERVLTEIDNLNRHRRPDGTHDPWVLDELLKNLIPYVKESGMPSAVSSTYQEYAKDYEDEDGRRNTFMWMGRTALQVAMSGKVYHKAPEAHARVDVEIEEARDAEQAMRAGFAKVFISPKMSKADAPTEVAKVEHLGMDDALRISWLDTDADGQVKGRHLESILVRDIPLDAWVKMLADSNNIFGKSVIVDNPDSALSVMKVFRELELPRTVLPEGAISLISEVLPYIINETARAKVAEQYEDFQKDQAGKHERARNIARRWRDFEVQMSDALTRGWVDAASDVTSFVYQMGDKWLAEDLDLIRAHQLPEGALYMTRPLAVLIESAKQKLLWDEASIVNNERHAEKQLDAEVMTEIRDRALRVQWLYASNRSEEARQLEGTNNRLIADQNMINGGGCPGESQMRFQAEKEGVLGAENQNQSAEDVANRKNWKTKIDACIVPNCPTRPGKVEVGPCGVCMGRCQKIYDKGGDPTKGKGIIMKAVIKQERPPQAEEVQPRGLILGSFVVAGSA